MSKFALTSSTTTRAMSDVNARLALAVSTIAFGYFLRKIGLVDIDVEPPVAVFEVDDGGEGAGPRIQKAREAITAATFTSEEDKPVVLGLYNDYSELTTVSGVVWWEPGLLARVRRGVCLLCPCWSNGGSQCCVRWP